MFKKTLSLLGIGVFAFMTAACQNEDTKDVAKDDTKHVETQSNKKDETNDSSQPKEKTSEATLSSADKKEESKDALVSVEPSFTIEKDLTTLYKNESGTIDYVGSNNEDNSMNFTIVLRATDKLVDSNINNSILRFITDDGTHFDLGGYQYTSVRMINGEKYYVYKTDEKIDGRKIVRIDGNLFENSDSMYEDKKFSVDVKTSKKTFTIPDMKFPNFVKTEINDTRENDHAKVTIEQLETPDITTHEFTVVGTLELKEDRDSTPTMAYLQPEVRAREVDEISTLNDSDSYYRNTKIHFTKTFKVDQPFGKNEVENVYFAIEGELFAYNIRTGKEIKNPNITRMDLDPSGINEDFWTPNGFVDVKGTRVYNAVQFTNASYSHGIDTTERIALPYAVGGYNKLSLNVGVGEKTLPNDTSYELIVYGNDFNDDEEKGVTGKVLAKKTITNKTPLEKMEFDIKGESNITFFIDTKSTEAGEDATLPIIFSDVVLEK